MSFDFSVLEKRVPPAFAIHESVYWTCYLLLKFTYYPVDISNSCQRNFYSKKLIPLLETTLHATKSEFLNLNEKLFYKKLTRGNSGAYTSIHS